MSTLSDRVATVRRYVDELASRDEFDQAVILEPPNANPEPLPPNLRDVYSLLGRISTRHIIIDPPAEVARRLARAADGAAGVLPEEVQVGQLFFSDQITVNIATGAVGIVDGELVIAAEVEDSTVTVDVIAENVNDFFVDHVFGAKYDEMLARGESFLAEDELADDEWRRVLKECGLL